MSEYASKLHCELSVMILINHIIPDNRFRKLQNQNKWPQASISKVCEGQQSLIWWLLSAIASYSTSEGSQFQEISAAKASQRRGKLKSIKYLNVTSTQCEKCLNKILQGRVLCQLKHRKRDFNLVRQRSQSYCIIFFYQVLNVRRLC